MGPSPLRLHSQPPPPPTPVLAAGAGAPNAASGSAANPSHTFLHPGPGPHAGAPQVPHQQQWGQGSQGAPAGAAGAAQAGQGGEYRPSAVKQEPDGGLTQALAETMLSQWCVGVLSGLASAAPSAVKAELQNLSSQPPQSLALGHGAQLQQYILAQAQAQVQAQAQAQAQVQAQAQAQVQAQVQAQGDAPSPHLAPGSENPAPAAPAVSPSLGGHSGEGLRCSLSRLCTPSHLLVLLCTRSPPCIPSPLWATAAT